MEKRVQIGVYRVLRKLGVERNQISLSSVLFGNYIFDNQDWQCFLFLLESKFNIDLTISDEQELKTVSNVINKVNKLI